MNPELIPLFDAHLHIVDPRFPLVANDGYLPATFTVADYHRRLARYRLVGGAVVSGSFQAFDQSYLVDALRRLGNSFVGVAQVPPTVTDAELHVLDAAGVRALRFNVRRGGSADLKHLQWMARHVHALLGWHVELYIDAAELPRLRESIVGLPAVCIDHLGLSRQGLDPLLRLVEKGVRVKASGFGRVDFDVAEALRRLHATNPRALMFGTDLPCTRAPRPYFDGDFELVVDTLGRDAAAQVLHGNARSWYRVRQEQPA